MSFVALEKLLDKTNNSIFELVIIASKRALEIAEGQPKLTENCTSSDKPTSIALQEIMEDKIRIKDADKK
jgi:DNA-directed RNA polymerase omega subunit